MSAADRKDPGTALFLSLLFPGAGFAYVGDVAKFVRALLVVGFLAWFMLRNGGGWWAVGAIHVFFAIASAGAARNHNRRLAATGAAIPPPPLVVSQRTRAAAPPPPPPPPPAPQAPSGPPLTTDEFLAELRDAWEAHRAGATPVGDFVARKLSAIERVRPRDYEDGVALLEATTALVGAGVLTPAERSRLKLRMGRA